MASRQVWIKSCTSVKFASLSPLGEFIHRSIALEPKSTSRRPVLIWLIVSQLLALLSLVFWLLAAGLSVMAFDWGVTREAWTIMIAVWSYPIWPLVFTIAAWIAYARKKDMLAAILTTFTFLPVLLLLIFIVVANLFYFVHL